MTAVDEKSLLASINLRHDIDCLRIIAGRRGQSEACDCGITPLRQSLESGESGIYSAAYVKALEKVANLLRVVSKFQQDDGRFVTGAELGLVFNALTELDKVKLEMKT